MALTLLSTPTQYEPVYTQDGDNLSFVLESTESALCSMKYVADIYVRGNYVTTIRNSPNLVDGKCVITINRVLEDFLSYDRIEFDEPFKDCTNSYLEYEILFGEETDGTYDCSGGSFEATYGLTFSGFAWNGTIQYGESFDSFDYQVGSYSLASFLTNSPDEQDIYLYENSYLYWLNTASMSQSLEIVETSTGGTSSYYYIDIATIVAPQITGCGVGPLDINTYVTQGVVYNIVTDVMTQSIITCDTASYSVRVVEFPWTFTNFSETKIFNVLCDCYRYQPYHIVWLNRRGGFDKYSFRLKSSRTITNNKKEWSRFLSSLQADNTFGYNIGDRGRSVYSSRSYESVSVVSEWQTLEEHNWVAEMFTSPEVYYVLGSTWYPIVVTNKSVTPRNKRGYGNRLLSWNVDFDYSFEIISQRG